MRMMLLAITMMVLTGCNQELSTKSIMLKASGSVQVKPDEASAAININCLNKDIQLAKDCLIAESASLNKILVGLGIAETDILTTQVNLNKSYVWRNNSNMFEGYKASTAVNVKIRDLDIISSFYTSLLSHDKFTINSLSYHHSEYDKLKNEAYLKALANSNDLAQELLANLPESEKEIIQISNVEIGSANPLLERKSLRMSEASSDNSAAGISITVGNMLIEQTLFVEYQIF